MMNIVSITDLKQNTSGVINKVKSKGDPVAIVQRSELAAVLVNPKHYKKLEQALEDLDDLRVIKERKNEPTIPFDKYFEKRFKKKFNLK